MRNKLQLHTYLNILFSYILYAFSLMAQISNGDQLANSNISMKTLLYLQFNLSSYCNYTVKNFEIRVKISYSTDIKIKITYHHLGEYLPKSIEIKTKQNSIENQLFLKTARFFTE